MHIYIVDGIAIVWFISASLKHTNDKLLVEAKYFWERNAIYLFCKLFSVDERFISFRLY